jgi:hypothetical protein
MFEAKNRTLVAALAFVALFAACSKVPQADVDAATASLAEAEATSAGVYAADQVAQAKLAVEAVNTEIATQSEKFGLFRSYDHTSELAAAAQQAAMAAKTAAETAKTAAMNEANAALEALAASEQSASALLDELGACRSKPKGFTADLETLSGTLSGFATQRAEVESAIAGEDYAGASQLAAAIQEQVDGLITEMTEAKAKIGC